MISLRRMDSEDRTTRVRKLLILTRVAATGVAALIASVLLARVDDPLPSPSSPDRLVSWQRSGGDIPQARDTVLSADRVAENPFDPLPFVSSALIASQGGREDEAEAKMRHALRLDPRSAPARSWLFNLYLREGRFAEAIDEASVLVKIKPSLEAPLSQTLAILSRLVDVRAIIIKRFSDTPLILAIIGALPAGQLGEQALFELAAATEPAARVDAQTRIIADLLGRRDYDATSKALRYFGLAPEAGKNLVHDGSFNGIKGPQPFSWSFLANADVRAEAESVNLPDTPYALRVQRFSATAAVAARQSILVQEGSYRLSHLVKASDQTMQAEPATGFQWTITCPALNTSPLASLLLKAANPSRWNVVSWTFEVPSTCHLIELALVSTATDFSTHSDLMISRLRLDPVGK